MSGKLALFGPGDTTNANGITQSPSFSNDVIVTKNQIRDSSTELDNFAGHKVGRGFSVKIVTENDFNTVTGPYPNRRAVKIRQWLIDNYQKMGVEYVLLIGNPDPDDPMYSNDIGDEINDPSRGGLSIHYRQRRIFQECGTLDRILRRTIDYENTAYHPSRRRILLPMKTMRSDGNVLLDRTYTLGEAITTQVAEPQGFGTYRIYDRDDYAGLIRPPESTPCNEKKCSRGL